MLNYRGPIRCALLVASLALSGGAFAADTGVSGHGSFKPAAAHAGLPPDSPFTVDDLASGHVSFSIRWDDATPDRDPSLYRGLYPGAIRQFTVRIGATEIALPVENAVFEVNDAGDLPNREFIRLQASQSICAHLLSVGWMSLNEIARTGDLRGAAGGLASDGQPNAERLVAFQPAGRFDRSFFVTLSSIADPRRYPIFLQTSAIEIKPMTVSPVVTR